MQRILGGLVGRRLMKQSVEQRSDVRCDREKSDGGSLVV